jgi:carbon-monoxide dehydrogenase large subunit
MNNAVASEYKQASELGAPVHRVEDERLLTGKGHYADDMALPNMAFAYVVRSPHAHATIVGIDTDKAKAAPGVLAVLTGEDVARENIGSLHCHSFPKLPPDSKTYNPTQPILVSDTVRHVGDRVALVVADTLAQAKNAGELIEIEYDVLPAVTLIDALAPDAPKVWDDSDSNVSFQIESGDKDAVEAQFATAAHVTKISCRYPRASANAMEPRAATAYQDPLDNRFTLCTSCQEPHAVKHDVAQLLGMSELNLRVVAMDIGGAFGMKGQTYPEEVLVVWAARKIGRPVKWTADRSESLATDMHGRGPMADAELAFDRDGRILAFRTSVAAELGAYLAGSAGVPPRNASISYPGTYHVPMIHAVVRATFTNTVQLGPYRGSGKPEATFVLERLMEKAAHEMGLDPIDLRRRNLIPPSDMPYQTPGGYVYDSGNFERILDRCIELADWDGFAERRTASESNGLRRGIGLALHCQRAGTFSERMEVRVGQDGSVALHVGTLATGQGHETMFAQMVSGWLDLPMDKIRVFQGDTDKVLFGRGTFAQRSMSAGGSALKAASEEVVEKGKRLSAWMLEASEEDMVFEDGHFQVAGTDKKVTFQEVVDTSHMGNGLPNEFGIGLDGTGTHEGAYSFPNGCMICEVEIDMDTGKIRVDRLAAMDDVGVVVNPLTLEGQLHGSIAQGLGEALTEQILYDRDSGQLITGSFMDYGMPRADMMPEIMSDIALVPTASNPLGVKGGSEAGNCGAPSAIVNAVIDALAPLGVTDIPIPATPERVWRAIHGT